MPFPRMEVTQRNTYFSEKNPPWRAVTDGEDPAADDNLLGPDVRRLKPIFLRRRRGNEIS
jgi:hypothetical protein